MGRTLHYEITKENGKSFTKTELTKLYDISMKYATMTIDVNGKEKSVWTCESFCLSPQIEYIVSHDKTKEEFYKEYERVKNNLKSKYYGSRLEVETIIQLKKTGYLFYFNSQINENMIAGYTKVQGNEFNALLVYRGLIEISCVLPNTQIRVNDEGRFLLCDVMLQNGKAYPLLREKKKSLHYYIVEYVLRAGLISASFPHINEISDDWLEDLRIIPSNDKKKTISKLSAKDTEGGEWGNFAYYIKQCLSDLVEIEKRLKKSNSLPTYPAKNCFYNIEQYRRSVNPYTFTRHVYEDDFQNFVVNASTLLGGFMGEYYDLTKEDIESLSYKQIGMIQKIIEKSVGNTAKIQILGENDTK